MNEHNQKLAEQGKKRRAKLLREHLNGKTPNELAEKLKISASRVRWMLKKAREDV